jgi:hypothetical protein
MTWPGIGPARPSAIHQPFIDRDAHRPKVSAWNLPVPSRRDRRGRLGIRFDRPSRPVGTGGSQRHQSRACSADLAWKAFHLLALLMLLGSGSPCRAGRISPPALTVRIQAVWRFQVCARDRHFRISQTLPKLSLQGFTPVAREPGRPYNCAFRPSPRPSRYPPLTTPDRHWNLRGLTV